MYTQINFFSKKYKINPSGSLVLWRKNKKDLLIILKSICHDNLNINNTKFLISLHICDSKKMRELNLKYREKDSTTDVLSFSQKHIFNNTCDLGDVFINNDIISCLKTKELQDNHFKFLFIHALLHIVGYDHVNSDDELKMKEKENEYLRKIGLRYDQMI